MRPVLLPLVVLWVVLVALYRLIRRRRLPAGTRPLPGPKGLPLIGRVHDVPAEATWLKFYEWSKVYGPIYQIEIFGTVHVWISSERVAHDLLSKRSLIYSDRPVIPNLPDNRTSGEYLALLGRTDTWKRQRKLCSQLMNLSATASLHTYPTRERNRFLYLMSRNPSGYREYIEQFTSRTISRLAWGSAHPAPLLRETTLGLLEAISPAGALPNVVSWLAHLPERLSPWKRRERRRHQLEQRLFRENVDFVRARMGGGGARPSFVRTFLERGWGETPWGCGTREATSVVGLMAIAGALTMGSPIQSFILAMCHYPEWLARLQGEIEATLGGECPEWGDRQRLPLLRAVVKEILRWRPPVPTGIPHALEKDDVYDGYFIPAGATIHALEWGIARDETIYPDPETFNPSRWLLPEYPTYREPLTLHPNLDGYSQFGFGRRTCQGVPVVEQDLFLSMGGLAWAFDIRKRTDGSGNPVPVHWNDYTPLLISKPVPFVFELAVRGPEREEWLSRAWQEAKKEEEEEKGVEGWASGEAAEKRAFSVEDKDHCVDVRI